MTCSQLRATTSRLSTDARVRSRSTGDCVDPLIDALQRVVAAAAGERVGARLPVQFVVTAPSLERVVLGSTGEPVGTLAADDEVVALTAVHGVRSAQPHDRVVAVDAEQAVIGRTPHEVVARG